MKGPSKTKGAFNIKATHTWALLLNFEEFCEVVGYSGTLIPLVAKLIKYLKIIYKWEFLTEKDWEELALYEREFPVFIEDWMICIGRDSNRNYYHTLAVEIPRSINIHKSVWKFSSDITETYVYILKYCIPLYSTRGGFKQNPTLQTLKRLCMHAFAGVKGWVPLAGLVSPWEKEKLRSFLENKFPI